MGGIPLSALSVVCFPQKGDFEVLGRILEGGQAAMNAEGISIVGGHSVDDAEIKIGYAVTGTIHPDKVITNAGAQPGDMLILTKPIGSGAINTAVKHARATAAALAAVTKAMTTSAAAASSAMVRLSASACTDITGFGLLGHAFEMARASRVTFSINSGDVPLLPDVLELIRAGMLTRGDKNNRVYVGDTIRIAASVSGELQSALFDPQTAGGLLVSIKEALAEEYVASVPGSRVIGRVDPLGQFLLRVE
jgi:selenide,water dikinase